jgi:ferritin
VAENFLKEPPMISKAMEKAINEQINKEIYSAYLYLSMSAFAKTQALDGFANWFYVQSLEEMIHAQKFYNYILDQGGKVELAKIDGPPTTFKSMLDCFEQTLKHEQFVTSRINALSNQAVEEKDHATQILLQWFVTEQIEEEASADAIRRKLALISNDGGALFMIDKDLAARVFMPPTPAA